MPREEVLERFATLVRATEEAAQEMRWACTHDRIISQVVKERMPEVAIALLSKCLHATRLLEPAELKGLLATVGSAVASKEELKGLARRARSSGEEAAMT